jgi:hypothetical protein
VPSLQGRHSSGKAGQPIRKLVKLKIIVIFLLILFCTVSPVEAWELAVSDPWLAVVARFVGGTAVQVRPLATWGDQGEVMALRQKTDTNVPTLRLVCTNPKNGTKCLYSALPVPGEKMGSLFFDPASLPFIGQRLLQLLSEWDPGNYSLFQRRLAEFQSRLDGNLAIGRKLIAGLPILDLTFLTTPWLQAASGDLLRPPEDHFETWRRGEGTDLLEEWLSRAQKEKRTVVADVWAPAVVKDRLANFTGSVVFPPPSLDLEWTLYLHDLYLALISATADRS